MNGKWQHTNLSLCPKLLDHSNPLRLHLSRLTRRALALVPRGVMKTQALAQTASATCRASGVSPSTAATRVSAMTTQTGAKSDVAHPAPPSTSKKSHRLDTYLALLLVL